MTHLLDLLKGKKTYIVATVAAVIVFLHMAGVIDQQAYETLLGLLGVTGLAALRAGMSNVQK